MFRTKENLIPTVNMISSGTEIKGDVNIEGDFRIDGKLYGNIKCTGKLTVGTTGYIEGQIQCKNAEIAGKIKGTLNTAELTSLKESSSFEGDISTSQITIEAGAKVSITCKTTLIGSEK